MTFDLTIIAALLEYCRKNKLYIKLTTSHIAHIKNKLNAVNTEEIIQMISATAIKDTSQPKGAIKLSKVTVKKYFQEDAQITPAFQNKLVRILNHLGCNITRDWLLSKTHDTETSDGIMEISMPSGLSEKHISRLSLENSLTGTYRILRKKISINKPEHPYVREVLDIFTSEGRIDFVLTSPNAAGPLRVFKGSIGLYREMIALFGVYEDSENDLHSLRVLTLNDEGAPSPECSRIRWGLLSAGIIGPAANGSPISRRVLLEKPDPKTSTLSDSDVSFLDEDDVTRIYGSLADTVRGLLGDHKITDSRIRIRLDDGALFVDQSIVDDLSHELVKQMDEKS